MLKTLLIQSIYKLSDDSMEDQINDRLSFMRFLKLTPGAKVPDTKTIWLFLNEFNEAKLAKGLFDPFDSYLKTMALALRRDKL